MDPKIQSQKSETEGSSHWPWRAFTARQHFSLGLSQQFAICPLRETVGRMPKVSPFFGLDMHIDHWTSALTLALIRRTVSQRQSTAMVEISDLVRSREIDNAAPQPGRGIEIAVRLRQLTKP